MQKERFNPTLVYVQKIEGIYNISDDFGFLEGMTLRFSDVFEKPLFGAEWIKCLPMFSVPLYTPFEEHSRSAQQIQPRSSGYKFIRKTNYLLK